MGGGNAVGLPQEDIGQSATGPTKKAEKNDAKVRPYRVGHTLRKHHGAPSFGRWSVPNEERCIYQLDNASGDCRSGFSFICLKWRDLTDFFTSAIPSIFGR